MNTTRPTRRARVAMIAIAAGAVIAAACAPVPTPPPDTVPPATTTTRPTTTTTRPPSTTTTTKPPSTTTTTKPPSTTTTTVPGAVLPLGPAGTNGTWKLKFSDDFNGSTLDLTKWRPNWVGGSDTASTPPINDYEESCYAPSQVSVSSGTLKLRGEKLSATTASCIDKDGARAQYRSGIVTTHDDYWFSQGYMEARVKLPGAGARPDNWSAFWANGDEWPVDGEIDVMETLGGEPRWHYHYENAQGQHKSYGSGSDLISPKTGWHTFGAEWTGNRINFYYDGEAVGSVTANVTAAEKYLILNYGLSNYISGPIVTPSTMEVDYVRVWQR